MTVHIDLDAPDQWPAAVISALEDVRPIMRAWELDLPEERAADYDPAIAKLEEALYGYSITGWHCTRLADEEIDNVRANGLDVLSADLVDRRISEQVLRGRLTAATGRSLISSHQANELNRCGRIWFCFYPPLAAGEHGLSRLLSYWGGEATNWAHEDNAAIASALRQLGTPCIVEAEVPLAWLPDRWRVATSLVRRDLKFHGEHVTESVRVEHFSLRPIPGHCIRAIHQFPNPDFLMLSGCAEWREALS